MTGVAARPPFAFADLATGMHASTRRTFSHADIAIFRDLAPDPAPIHTDPDWAKEMGYSDVLIFGWLVAAPFSGILGAELPGPSTVLHSVRINMAAPVYPGDEILYRAEIKQLSSATKVVVLELVATRASNMETVLRGQAQCGFRT